MISAAVALLVGGCEYLRPLPASSPPRAPSNIEFFDMPDQSEACRQALAHCATPQACANLILELSDAKALNCGYRSGSPFERFGAKAISSIAQLLSPNHVFHRAAIGVRASEVVADVVAVNPEVYTDSYWPVLIEVAISSRINPSVCKTIKANASKHSEWFVQDLTYMQGYGSFDQISRARLVLTVLGRESAPLAHPIAA